MGVTHYDVLCCDVQSPKEPIVLTESSMERFKQKGKGVPLLCCICCLARKDRAAFSGQDRAG